MTGLRTIGAVLVLLVLLLLTAGVVTLTNARVMELVLRQVFARSDYDVRDFHLDSLVWSFPASWTAGGAGATILLDGRELPISIDQVEIGDGLNWMTRGKRVRIRIRGAEMTSDLFGICDASCDAEVSRGAGGLFYGGTVLLGEVSRDPGSVSDVTLAFEGDGQSIAVSNLAAAVYGGKLSGNARARWPGSFDAELLLNGGDSNTLFQLGGLIPGADDLRISGTARLVCSGTPSAAEASVFLAVNSLDFPAQKLSLRNLETACTMRFPGELRSLGEQKLTAERLAVGDFEITQVRMTYQLEPESTLLIEDLGLNWCGGQVLLAGLRAGPQSTNVSARVVCDRLSLAQVLAACGLSGFSGDGELNGQVPLQWSSDGLRIDRGLLFTTPGRGGVFSFGNTGAIAEMLPAGSLVEGQIGLVAEALSSFRYNSISMALNSAGENLLVAVSLDGQPVNVLPYEYDSRSGTYGRVALRPGRGIRQPMTFTLNLTIPLNQLICYAVGVNRQWNLFKARP